MKRHSFYIYITILLCSALLLPGAQHNVNGSRSGSFCAYNGNELVLLGDLPADASDEPSVNIQPNDFSSVALQNLIDGYEYYCNTVTPVREVVIAVLDTGIDTQHPLLSDYIWTNPGEIPGDGIDNDENGYIDDVHGWDFYHDDSALCNYEAEGDNDNHGTHVAGIITSVLKGGNLFYTEQPKVPVKIMPLKIHGGEKASGSVANAIKAIKYAEMMGADICNISWGTSSITSSIPTLEQTIRESDMLFVAAAGNTGSDNDLTPVYPASFRMDNVISVTFVNPYGLLTTKSNYGADNVDIAAPGTDIYSTTVGSFAYMSGSSMAVPYVSAVAAFLYSCEEGLSPAAVRELLLSTACPLPSDESFTLPESMFLAKDKLITPAFPDLYRLLMSRDMLRTDKEAPVLTVTSSYTKDFIRLNVIADDAEGSGIRTVRYAVGTKSLQAFRRGTAGTPVNDGSIRIAKSGTYTIYASDYAGNETVLPLLIDDDTTAPQSISSVHSSPSGTLHRLIAHISDEESGIDMIYFAPGEYTVGTFPFDTAQVLTLHNNRINLLIDTSGYYTLYVSDHRGNITITTFVIPTADDIKKPSSS